jgi:hypothetical protein
MPYVEVKTRETINRGLALSLIEKGTISAVITTGTINPIAKKLFDEAGITWVENIPDSELVNVKKRRFRMEIIFYAKNGQQYILEVSDSFYKWLALSEFSRIQTSMLYKVEIEGDEAEEIQAVELTEQSRKIYISFFQKCILSESYELILKMESSSKPGLLKASSFEGSLENLQYRIKKFYEFIRCLEDLAWVYMEYV